MTLNELGRKVFNRDTEELDLMDSLLGNSQRFTAMARDSMKDFEDGGIELFVENNARMLAHSIIHTFRIAQALGFDIEELVYEELKED